MRAPLGLAVAVQHPTAARRTKSEDTRLLQPRDDSTTKPNVTSIIVAAVVVGVLLLTVTCITVRALRIRHPNPKYVPTPFLKRLWSSWRVPTHRTSRGYRLPEDAAGDGDSSLRPSRSGGFDETLEIIEARQGTARGGGRRDSRGTAATGEAAGVDRNTSIRSVMTLPAYRTQATDTEQVLGREGERDGIDVVVEQPTAEDEEALREEEMESLYQIRLARRRQIAERDERRVARRDARAANNAVALERLRDEGRTAAQAGQNQIDDLRREHVRAKENRSRAVSSVSYHDVGVVRADGTRIRAGSFESERAGLLSDAASIAAGSLSHRRDRSTSSVLSLDTAHSGEGPGGGLNLGGGLRSRAGSGVNTPLRSRAGSGANTPRLSPRAGSSPEMINAEDAEDEAAGDLGGADMPPHSPPGYDDVSLDDGDAGTGLGLTMTPARGRSRAGSGASQQARSGANSPYNEPPPDYPGPTQARNERLSAQVADLLAEEGDAAQQGAGAGGLGHARKPSRGVGGVPQLPSLRLSHLPQIVIEPSSARPRDDE